MFRKGWLTGINTWTSMDWHADRWNYDFITCRWKRACVLRRPLDPLDPLQGARYSGIHSESHPLASDVTVFQMLPPAAGCLGSLSATGDDHRIATWGLGRGTRPGAPNSLDPPVEAPVDNLPRRNVPRYPAVLVPGTSETDGGTCLLGHARQLMPPLVKG